MIPLPDPPLVWPPAGSSGPALRLRPWHPDDAPALVAAWADPQVQRWTRVPPVRDLAYAERWIAGEGERRRRWLSLDLVVVRDGDVAGEVGLSSLDRTAGTAEVGWWTAVAHRGQGVASAAVGLVARWAEAELGLHVHAVCHRANPASIAVARRAGVPVTPG